MPITPRPVPIERSSALQRRPLSLNCQGDIWFGWKIGSCVKCGRRRLRIRERERTCVACAPRTDMNEASPAARDKYERETFQPSEKRIRRLTALFRKRQMKDLETQQPPRSHE